jgi:hypothetical protein
VTVALVALATIPAWLTAGGVLIAYARSEQAHRTERERLMRALLAKNLPEFASLTRIVEGDRGAEQRAEAAARVRAVRTGLVPDEDDDSWPAGVPRVPEGMTG